MKKLFLFLLISFLVTIVYGQNEKPLGDSIFIKIDLEAAFPGGNPGWRRFLEMNLNPSVPVDNGAKPKIYTVVIQFLVDTAGNISDIRPLTNHGYGMEAEVMRVIAKGPKWEPAIFNGRKVKAYRKQPVTFAVSRE